MNPEQLVVIRQCEAAADCRNSIDRAGPERARCRLCLYSGHGRLPYWKPDRKRLPQPCGARLWREQQRRRRQ